MPVNVLLIPPLAKPLAGCGYVYGATAHPCEPDYRADRAKQYPSYKATIERNCQRTNKLKKGSCSGCQYSGKLLFDCAQLTKYILRLLGISIPSGATSQWNSDCWSEKGDIAQAPDVPGVLLFRREGDGMGHVGLTIGGGLVIEAKGHDFGVLITEVCAGTWTHYAKHKGLDYQEEVILMDSATVVAVSGKSVNMRKSASSAGNILKKVPVGTTVMVLAWGETWSQVMYAGTTGYMMTSYLEKAGPSVEERLSALEKRILALETK